MISRDSIESAYSFFHQKWNVFRHSAMEWQKDDIEYAIGQYVDDMNPELYAMISKGNPDFMKLHSAFAIDMESAVSQLETLLESLPGTAASDSTLA